MKKKQKTQKSNTNHPLYGKIFIEGELEVLTGLHIGGPQGPLEIGGIDLAVIRDPMTQEPYISGSSLRGKMRSLFERRRMRSLSEGQKDNFLEKIAGTREKPIRIHVCNAVECEVCRLFGSSPPEGQNIPSPLLVRDLHLTDESKADLEGRISSPLPYVEWKSENVLDRITAHATPRDIERVPRGAKFHMELVYNVADLDNIEEDLRNLVCAMGLLEDDTLGGHGSRGYGKVRFWIDKIEVKRVEYYERKDQDRYIKTIKKINGEEKPMKVEELKMEISSISKKMKRFLSLKRVPIKKAAITEKVPVGRARE
jgi:CRISPR-associated protein Csm3